MSPMEEEEAETLQRHACLIAAAVTDVVKYRAAGHQHLVTDAVSAAIARLTGKAKAAERMVATVAGLEAKLALRRAAATFRDEARDARVHIHTLEDHVTATLNVRDSAPTSPRRQCCGTPMDWSIPDECYVCATCDATHHLDPQ